MRGTTSCTVTANGDRSVCAWRRNARDELPRWKWVGPPDARAPKGYATSVSPSAPRGQRHSARCRRRRGSRHRRSRARRHAAPHRCRPASRRCPASSAGRGAHGSSPRCRSPSPPCLSAGSEVALTPDRLRLRGRRARRLDRSCQADLADRQEAGKQRLSGDGQEQEARPASQIIVASAAPTDPSRGTSRTRRRG